MNIIEISASVERCTEAGWSAYDFHMDMPVEYDTIMRFKPFGNFLYLDMLKEPFYKIESDNYIIKGIAGKDYFRVAAHQEQLDIVKQIEKLF